MMLLGTPSVAMGRVAQTVKQDPAMAANLLRMANSAAFGAHGPVTSIRDALVRIGIEGTRRRLYQTSTARILAVKARPDLTARLQVRSGAVAHAAARIATHHGSDAETAFLAGLLHDVGWAVGYGLLARLQSSLPAELATDEVRAQHTVDALHTEIGATLARSWNLPPSAVDAIAGHHQPAETGAGLMAHIVYAATHLCDTMGIGPVEPPEGELADNPIVKRLRLDRTSLAAIRVQLTEDLR
jgi:putative nucleotidyltransferase with HDIG domain